MVKSKVVKNGHLYLMSHLQTQPDLAIHEELLNNRLSNTTLLYYIFIEKKGPSKADIFLMKGRHYT